MIIPIFDWIDVYTHGDLFTLRADTPADIVEEFREGDDLYFGQYKEHFVDFSIVDGTYRTPALEARDIPGGEIGEALKKTLKERLGDKVVFFEGRAFLLSGTPRLDRSTPELGDIADGSSCFLVFRTYRYEFAPENPPEANALLPYIWGAPTHFRGRGKYCCLVGKSVGGRIYRARIERIRDPDRHDDRARVTYLGSIKAGSGSWASGTGKVIHALRRAARERAFRRGVS